MLRTKMVWLLASCLLTLVLWVGLGMLVAESVRWEAEAADGGLMAAMTPNTEHAICSDPNVQLSPAIYGNRVVWEDNRHGNWEVYLYDLTTQTETRIATNSHEQWAPSLGIYGERIVWVDDRHGNQDIYLYDLTTLAETRITLNNYDQWGPEIYGNRIVWEDERNGQLDIYMYDLLTQIETQLTTDPHDQWSAAISGDRIVWQDDRNGNWDIYLYDLSTGQETRVTTDPHDQQYPVISGNRIVWDDNRHGNWDIYLYDLSTGQETPVTTDPHNQIHPQISGERIVWYDYRHGNTDIYMHDLSTGSELRITTDGHGQWDPVIFGERIAWVDDRNGKEDIYSIVYPFTPCAELAISMKSLPDPVTVNQYVAYQVIATNHGPLVATGVRLTDTLPAGASFVSASSTQGSCSASSGQVWCGIGDLPSGKSATVTIVLMATDVVTLTNTASVAGDSTECILSNNTVTTSTPVRSAPDVIVTLSLASVTDTLTFNQSHTGYNWLEYRWGVRVDTDSNRHTGDGAGYDVEISLTHWRHPSYETCTDTILRAQKNTWPLGGTGSGHWIQATLDPESKSIIMTGDKSWPELADLDPTDRFYGLTLYEAPSGTVRDTTPDNAPGTNTVSDPQGDVPYRFIDITGVRLDLKYHLPNIAVAPAALDFGALDWGASLPLTTRISNTGVVDLIVLSATITGENASEFNLSTDCSIVAPGAVCGMTVVFRPASRGEKHATLVISSSDPDTPVVHVALRGAIPTSWARTYGTSGDELVYAIQPSPDGGYVVAGEIESPYYSILDSLWVFKLDEDGAMEWQKAMSLGRQHNAHSLQTTHDGGYILAGRFDFSSYYWELARHAAFAIKLDARGAISWTRVYSAYYPQEIHYSIKDIRQTADGGYIFVGGCGYGDSICVAKVDQVGRVQYIKGNMTAEGWGAAYSVRPTMDGGYVLAGESLTHTAPGAGARVIKLDENGEIQWHRVYRLGDRAIAASIQQTPVGGYVVAGEVAYLDRPAEGWILGLDGDGEIQWQKAYRVQVGDVTGSFHIDSIQLTADGGYIADAHDDLGRWCVVLKLDPHGDAQWIKGYHRIAEYSLGQGAIQQTPDGGYILAGYTRYFGAGGYDALILKLDARGDILGCPQGLIVTPTVTVYDTNASITSTLPYWRAGLGSSAWSVFEEETNASSGEVCPGYDGNQDGIPDNLQDNVASFLTYDGQYRVTLASPEGTTLTDAKSIGIPSPRDAPAKVFRYGFFEFAINDVGVSGATAVTLHLPPGLPEYMYPTTYYKYGPTPEDATNHWYEFLYDGETGAEIGGNRVTLHFVDGKRGDDDLMANGVIVEPGGPASAFNIVFLPLILKGGH